MDDALNERRQRYYEAFRAWIDSPDSNIEELRKEHRLLEEASAVNATNAPPISEETDEA